MTQEEFYVNLSVNLKLIGERSTPEIATTLAILRWAIDGMSRGRITESDHWMEYANHRIANMARAKEGVMP